MKKPCIAVAAGDRHSVALTREGEVYTWGDNTSSQLGRNRKSGIERVEALWTCERRAIQVEASEQSTLVLIRPPRRESPHNSVYTWGHGNPHPIRVTFDNGGSSYLSIPIDIACAKNHSAAVTKDGKVFTFGLHSDSLGSKQAPSLVVASPVTGMLPENGGGWAVAVSASDQYTAVVTSEGHLFTWGSTSDKNVMGHEGRRWQPSPKRVDGVHRAVSVAVAKEHTVLLIGTTFPKARPFRSDSSLASLAAKHVCNHVDMFNVIPILIMAERLHSSILQEYCRRFVRENMDGVLTFARKSELDTYLNEMLAERQVKLQRDGTIHPLVMQAIMVEASTSEWLVGCRKTFDNLPVSTLVRYRRRATRRATSFHEHRRLAEEPQENLQAGHQGCSERCLVLTANLNSLNGDGQIRAKYECLSKEIRGIKKRLNQISKLLGKETVSSMERDKLNRKPLLEADLDHLSRALDRVQKMMSERNIEIKSIDDVVPEGESLLAPDDSKIAPDAASFHCDVCGVTCPNGDHLELHKSGRKHRNRVKQMEEEEKEQTAHAILEEKRQQLFLADTAPSPPVRRNPDPVYRKETVQPRYQLPPPQIPPGPHVVGKTTPNWASPIPLVKAKSLRSILAEEEKGKAATRQSQQFPKKPPGLTQGLLSPGSVPPLRNAPWATAPIVNVSAGPVRELKQAPWAAAASVSIPVAKTPVQSSPGSLLSASFVNQTPQSKVKKQSLGEFLTGPKVVTPPVHVAAPWAVQSSSKNIPSSVTSPLPKSKSLFQIQQEEEEFAKRQSKHVAKEAKWFIGRVDRAESFSALQEIDAQEREMRLLIEEQIEIEKQIALERKQKDAEKEDKTNKRSRRRHNQGRPAGDKKDKAESKSTTDSLKQVKEPQSNRKQPQNKLRESKRKGNNVGLACPEVKSP